MLILQERDNNRTRALLAGYYRTEDSDPSAYANSLPVTARGKLYESGRVPVVLTDGVASSFRTCTIPRF